MTKDVQLADCRLHVLDEGRGPVLLLVHGFPLDHSMWREQASGLAGAHRVVAPDLRGFGLSVVPSLHGRSQDALDTISMAQLADDLAALLDALGIQEPITLCGLSMGGYVAFEFWRRHGSRLARLILCDTQAVADTPEAARGRFELADKVLSQGAMVVAEAMLPKLISPANMSRLPAVVEAVRQMILRTPPATIAAALRGLAGRDDFTSRLSQIDVPSLVICGQHDAICPPEKMRGLAAALPNARYVEIAGAGHVAPLESPAEVNAAVREFLAS